MTEKNQKMFHVDGEEVKELNNKRTRMLGDIFFAKFNPINWVTIITKVKEA